MVPTRKAIDVARLPEQWQRMNGSALGSWART
jgi:hypothetical protein